MLIFVLVILLAGCGEPPASLEDTAASEEDVVFDRKVLEVRYRPGELGVLQTLRVLNPGVGAASITGLELGAPGVRARVPGGEALPSGGFATIEIVVTSPLPTEPHEDTLRLSGEVDGVRFEQALRTRWLPSCDVDEDGDVAWACGGGDCDDDDAGVGPHVEEVCDGVDRDCDGEALQVGDEACVAPPACADDAIHVPANAPTLDEALGMSASICLGPGHHVVSASLVSLDAIDLVGPAGSTATTIELSADTIQGAWLSLEGGQHRLAGLRFVGGRKALSAQDAAVSLVDVAFEGLTGGANTGALALSAVDSFVSMTDVVVSDGGPWSAAAIRLQGGIFEAQGLRLERLHTEAAVIELRGTTASVASVFLRDVAAGAGAFDSDGVLGLAGLDSGSTSSPDLQLRAGAVADVSQLRRVGDGVLVRSEGASLTLSHATVSGGLLWQNGGDVVVSNVVIEGGPAFSLAGSEAELTVDHATVRVDGAAPAFEGGSAASTVVVTNSTFEGAGPLLDPAMSGSPAALVAASNNNLDLDGGAPMGPGDLAVDARLLDSSRLELDSPLVDAGLGLDPDGSPADLGAFGGPLASAWDLDLDGAPAWWQPGPWSPSYLGIGLDCDDEDPSTTLCL